METLQIINLVITALSGGFALLLTVSKSFRQWLHGMKNEKKRLEETERDSRETDKCLLRDRITSTYYRHYKNRSIKQYEYENVERLYRQYKKLGGNSFVDKIWEEMQDWHIE